MLLGPALAISAVLFTLGVAGVLLRRNAIVIFMCVELMLNAVNLTFVALAQRLGMAVRSLSSSSWRSRRPKPVWDWRSFSPSSGTSSPSGCKT